MKSLEAKIAEMQAGALQVFRTEPLTSLSCEAELEAMKASAAQRAETSWAVFNKH